MRLIVFNRPEAREDYVREAVKLDPMKMWRPGAKTLTSPDGLVERLAVVTRMEDVDKLRGLELTSVHFENPPKSWVIEDELKNLVLSRGRVGP